MWVYVDVDMRTDKCIELLTNGDGVTLESRGRSGRIVRLFELRWTAFGDCLKDRLVHVKMKVVFVKNTHALRIDIPVLEK